LAIQCPGLVLGRSGGSHCVAANLSGIVVLLVIACLSFLAQDAAASSRSSQGLPLHQVAGNALGDTGRLLGGLL
jgi:hypothetical protein